MIKNAVSTEKSTVSDNDSAAVDITETGDARVKRGRPLGRASGLAKPKTSLRAIAVLVIAIGLVAAIGVLGWQLRQKSNDLDAMHTTAADEARAEQIALDYASGAAAMDFKDLGAWRARLTTGTSPELSERLTQAANSMQQIIEPLQWVSTATPIAAKVLSEDNGVFNVSCFVNVTTTNSQATDGIQSTATYRLSIDSRNDWLITDIGGIDSALDPSAVPTQPGEPLPR